MAKGSIAASLNRTIRAAALAFAAVGGLFASPATAAQQRIVAIVDAQSAARRDRVYQANRAKLEAAARVADPKATPEQVRAAWMGDHPLGWVEHRLAWGPSGELGKWATSNSAIVKIGGTVFVH